MSMFVVASYEIWSLCLLCYATSLFLVVASFVKKISVSVVHYDADNGHNIIYEN